MRVVRNWSPVVALLCGQLASTNPAQAKKGGQTLCRLQKLHLAVNARAF